MKILMKHQIHKNALSKLCGQFLISDQNYQFSWIDQTKNNTMSRRRPTKRLIATEDVHLVI